jgi:hypothetical protein
MGTQEAIDKIINEYNRSHGKDGRYISAAGVGRRDVNYKGSGMSLDNIQRMWTLEQLDARAKVFRREVNKYKKSLEISKNNRNRDDIERYTKSLNTSIIDSRQATRALNIKKSLIEIRIS